MTSVIFFKIFSLSKISPVKPQIPHIIIPLFSIILFNYSKTKEILQYFFNINVKIYSIKLRVIETFAIFLSTIFSTVKFMFLILIDGCSSLVGIRPKCSKIKPEIVS